MQKARLYMCNVVNSHIINATWNSYLRSNTSWQQWPPSSSFHRPTSQDDQWQRCSHETRVRQMTFAALHWFTCRHYVNAYSYCLHSSQYIDYHCSWRKQWWSIALNSCNIDNDDDDISPVPNLVSIWVAITSSSLSIIIPSVSQQLF